MEERPGKERRIAGALGFNAGLFEQSTIDRLVRHHVRVLAAVAADPDCYVRHIPLLDE